VVVLPAFEKRKFPTIQPQKGENGLKTGALLLQAYTLLALSSGLRQPASSPIRQHRKKSLTEIERSFGLVRRRR
jgi:hypothetical protein